MEAGLLGAIAGSFVLLPFVIKAGMGPADSLLLAGVGAWEGWRFALVAAFCASLVGALLALVAIALRRRALPYVPAITFGTLAAFVLLPFALSGQAAA
ncbi:MAG: prepilin peptidase [Chloroflexota bacterium]|nr:prepilin peptidase [Chloroflexota bacterium]